MYCKNCGNNLPDNASFCNSCGTAISKPPVSAEPKNESSADKTVAYTDNNIPVYQSPVQPAPPVTPSSSNKKTGLYIAIAAIGAVIIIALTVVLVVLLGGKTNKPVTEETTASSAASDKPELLEDPITYFAQQPDGYYKVTTDSTADFYIYPEYGSEDHYTTRFAGNELIFVYGTYNGWACFEYTDSAKGYAWCKTASIYKTQETPTQPEPETVYVPVYTDPDPQPQSSYVQPGSYYRVRGTGSAGLNLRSSPNTSAYVYVVLQESEVVYVHQTNGTWSYVSTVDYRTGNDYEGWCANQYLSFYY